MWDTFSSFLVWDSIAQPNLLIHKAILFLGAQVICLFYRNYNWLILHAIYMQIYGLTFGFLVMIYAGREGTCAIDWVWKATACLAKVHMESIQTSA
jgi:hypothetical protein